MMNQVGAEVAAVQELLDLGADVNYKDEGSRDGNSFLHVATLQCRDDIVALLIRYNADVTATNKHGDTPLHYTAFGYCERVVDILCGAGADVEAKNHYGETALLKAVMEKLAGRAWHMVGPTIRFTQPFPRSVVSALLEHGADIFCIDNVGLIPLHAAALHGQYEVLQVLTQTTPLPTLTLPVMVLPPLDINYRIGTQLFDGGLTVLNCAVFSSGIYEQGSHQHRQHLDLLLHLVSLGADLHTKTNNGDTLLHFAVRCNSLQTVLFLIEHGADLSDMGADGVKPVDLPDVSNDIKNMLTEEELRRLKCEAFLMGLRKRIGDYSVVQGLDAEVARMVVEAAGLGL
jgi:ankyrin repeat protein